LPGKTDGYLASARRGSGLFIIVCMLRVLGFLCTEFVVVHSLLSHRLDYTSV
jgi:hypothetical protein